MPREIIYNNLTFKIGKNAKENWELIDKASDDDIWIHLNDYPSGHVIIENIKDITNDDIFYGCLLCKKYSKYKNCKSVRCSILERKFIKKGKSIGEVILKKTPIIFNV